MATLKRCDKCGYITEGEDEIKRVKVTIYKPSAHQVEFDMCNTCAENLEKYLKPKPIDTRSLNIIVTQKDA